MTTFLSIKESVLARLMVIKDFPSPDISDVIQITFDCFSEAKKLRLVRTDLMDSANTDFGFSSESTCLLDLSSLVGKVFTTPIIGILVIDSTVSLSKI